MFKLTIKTANAAFSDDPGHEVARILRDVASKTANGYREGVVMDANGNRVGSWNLKGRARRPNRK